jgi:hypothetical protein
LRKSRTRDRRLSSSIFERAYPRTIVDGGRCPCVNSANNAGYVFFFARSPLHPKTVIVRHTLGSSHRVC